MSCTTVYKEEAEKEWPSLSRGKTLYNASKSEVTPPSTYRPKRRFDPFMAEYEGTSYEHIFRQNAENKGDEGTAG